jgi:antitoxin HicB
MCSRQFETRSLPRSLAATHRGFAFYVANPFSSFADRTDAIGLGEHIRLLRTIVAVATVVAMKFRVTIEPDEDGIFIAQCPALPGCVSQGKTYDEAMTNIRDAIQGYLESLKKHGEPIPSPITEAIVEVPV